MAFARYLHCAVAWTSPDLLPLARVHALLGWGLCDGAQQEDAVDVFPM